MEKEIKEIIEKSLPEQVGSVLKIRIEQAEKDAKLVEKYEQENQNILNQIGTLRLELDEYKKFDERNSKLDERESEINEKEAKLTLSNLEVRLEEANKRADAANEFVSNLTRNVSYRKSIYDTESIPGYVNHDGQYVCDRNVTKKMNQEEDIV